MTRTHGAMLVSEVMTPDPLTVGVEARVGDVRERILACGGHAVPVVDGDQRPVGVITATDLFEGLPPELPVRAAASRRVLAVEAGATVGEAARLMRRHGVHHLVVTRRGVIVGIVSSYDLLTVLEHLVGDDGLPPVVVPGEPRIATHG